MTVGTGACARTARAQRAELVEPHPRPEHDRTLSFAERLDRGLVRLLGQRGGHQLDHLLFERGPRIGARANRDEPCSSAKRRAARKDRCACLSGSAADDEQMPVGALVCVARARCDQRAEVVSRPQARSGRASIGMPMSATRTSPACSTPGYW